MMEERIGLLAGSGRLPIHAARGILAAGFQLVAVGLAEEADPELAAELPALAMIPVGNLRQMSGHFRAHEVSRLIMAGKVHKPPLFAGAQVDEDFLRLLSGLPRKNDDAILGAVVGYFAQNGLEVLPQTEFLRDLLVPKGVLSSRLPDVREKADIAFGFEMAKQIGRLDFGQSVVVKSQAVLAVEAVEGTDETIRRGGRLGHGRAVLVKVSKPQQDLRFDVPTVGPDTIASMEEAGVSVLALEAEKTFFLEKSVCLAKADAAGLAVVAVDNNGVF